jgi:hypothetical protein
MRNGGGSLSWWPRARRRGGFRRSTGPGMRSGVWWWRCAGVGILVAAKQLPDMLGIAPAGTGTVSSLTNTLAALPDASPQTAAVALAVIAVMLAARMITRRIPGALIAIAGRSS